MGKEDDCTNALDGVWATQGALEILKWGYQYGSSGCLEYKGLAFTPLEKHCTKERKIAQLTLQPLSFNLGAYLTNAY